MTQETIEKTFQVAAPAQLTLSNIRGSVEVLPGEEGHLSIVAVKHLDSGDARRTQIEMTQNEDGRVVVATRFDKAAWLVFGWNGWPCRVDYLVRTPHDCSAQVECVSSSALVQGLTGEVDLRTVSGKLGVRDVSGALKLTSVSGKIIGERLSGPARIETVSGKVSVLDSHLPTVHASSVSADLTLQTPLGEGPYHFKSMSGAIKLILQPAAGCSVETRSVSGRFRTSLPITRNERSGRHWHVDLQGGGPAIQMNSVSGSLWIVQSANEEPISAPETLSAQPGIAWT